MIVISVVIFLFGVYCYYRMTQIFIRVDKKEDYFILWLLVGIGCLAIGTMGTIYFIAK